MDLPSNKTTVSAPVRIGRQPPKEEQIWADDISRLLGKNADFYTNALLATKNCYVLNLDGRWGIGKTFFIDRWAKELDYKGIPSIIYNAWQNDCDEDPLVSLAIQILDLKFPNELKDSFTSAIGKIALSLGKILANGIGQRAIEYIAGKDVAGKGIEVLREGVSAISETSIDKLGKLYIEDALKRKTFLNNFKKSLESITNYFAKDRKQLFVFVDELDRCKPLFAIELLERIKHLFDVDNIKFIIASDNEQLCASIRSIYGSTFNAEKYLYRFFDMNLKLPKININDYIAQLVKNTTFKDILSPNSYGAFFIRNENDLILNFLPDLLKPLSLSLRDINQVFCKAFFVFRHIRPFSQEEKYIPPHLIFFLCSLYLKHDEYKKLYEEMLSTDWQSIVPYWKELKKKYYSQKNPTILFQNIIAFIGIYFGEDSNKDQRYSDYIMEMRRNILKKLFEAVNLTAYIG